MGLCATQPESVSAANWSGSNAAISARRPGAAPSKQGRRVTPGFESKIEITGSGIKELLNNPHEFYNEKNLFAYDLDRVIRSGTYFRQPLT